MDMTQEGNNLVLNPQRNGMYCLYHEFEVEPLFQGEGIATIPKPNRHQVYRVEFQDETTYVAPTLLVDTGILNFRDLGGIRNCDNQQVRYRCFYRSAPIIPHTDSEKAYLQELALKTNLDLRSDVEAESEPDLILDGCEYLRVSAMAIHNTQFSGSFDFSQLLNSGNLQKLRDYLEDNYKTMPFQNEAYQVMFQRLLDDEVPIVFHCSAGKDRTGVAAYLILKTLGVSDDVIMQDYLASNIYRRVENEKMSAAAGEHQELVASLMCVQASYLQATMQAIHERYGDFKTYLEKEYNIKDKEIALLKARYLYAS